jgi:hypothetical protein
MLILFFNSIGMTRKKVRFYGRPKDLKVKTDIYKAKRDEFIENGKVFYSLDETSFVRVAQDMVDKCMDTP